MHVIDGLGMGGAERMLVDIANQSVIQGLRVSVCVTRSCLDLAGSLDSIIRLHTLGRNRRFDVAALRRFSRIVREEKVDILHVHGRSSLSMLALLKLLGWVRAPVVFHDHYGWIETETSIPIWFRIAGRFLLNHYVGVYEKLGAWAKRAGVPQQRISVVNNTIDFSRFASTDELDVRKEFRLEGKGRVGVMVAGIRPAKGIDVLLEALALHPLPPGTKILIVGGAPDKAYLESCQRQASSLLLESTALFVGNRGDVPAILKGADFAVMPSRSESGPLVLIEYMLAGLPFVSTQVGDISSRAKAAGATEFVPPENAPALRSAVDRLLTLSPEAWQARSATGREIALNLFDIRYSMSQWHHIYQMVLTPGLR